MRRRVPGGAAVAVLAALAAPQAALAHGIVGKQDLPIPRLLFVYGASVVLVVSFVALATLWPTPRLERRRERVIARVPAALDVLAGAVGVALFALVVVAGLAGSQSQTENLAPTFIYVLFWVGIPFASLLLGDVMRAFSPWRAIARAAGFVAGRLGAAGASSEPLAYPARLGRWPAALSILAFAWLELVYADRDDPSQLAVLALAYLAIQLVGMALYGTEPWLRNADGFGVAFGLFARLAPLHWRDRTLAVRRPLQGVTDLDTPPGTVALLATMIGTTTFDGFSQGPLWSGEGEGRGISGFLQDRWLSVGFSQEHALELAYTVGLIGCVVLVAGLYRAGVAGMRSVAPGLETTPLARRFVHSLVPIALAYVVAHYFSLLAYQGQATAYLASDPLGDGANLLGTAGSGIDYGVVSANAIWYVQVGALVLGHAAGLTLAHDRALLVFRKPREATRSQMWMLAVMVGFTCLGLWLLSASNSA